MRHRTWAVSPDNGARGQRVPVQAETFRAGLEPEPTGPGTDLCPAAERSPAAGGNALAVAFVPARRFSLRGSFSLLAAMTSATLVGVLGIPVTAAGAQTVPPDMVTVAALGDSYSSGEGSPPFDLGATGCRRSTSAWPLQMAALDPPLTPALQAACGGATTANLTRAQGANPAQLDQLRSLPTPPTVVTITIGGNDAGFSRVLLSCVVWKCFWTGDERRKKAYLEDDLPPLLVQAYKDVKAAAPHSRIIVVGYPDIFPRFQRDNTCSWLSSSERRKIVSLNNTLNRTIRDAAKVAEVEFASIDRALRGHEMCTDDPWVNPIGLASPSRDLSAHPTQEGQAAIARTVHEKIFDDR